MSHRKACLLAALVVAAPLAAAEANAVTDWDEKAVAFVQPKMAPPPGYRIMTMVHLAMFEAVNAIEKRYKPYLAELPTVPGESPEAAAASAAATVLTKLFPDAAADLQGALTAYLATLPEAGRVDGAQLGELAALKILEARADDGAASPDAYRPKAKPGLYVPTPLTVASQWPNLKPFAMTTPSQFRPKPPVALKSAEWARDYNEIKALGGKNSTVRTARQTEDARFWILTGPLSTHPLVRQIALRQEMSLVDTARLMALVAVAESDAIIAVMDAKYKYDFWRPITAIRNGDIDGNPATEREATWQPIDNTPLHPEYPCAHCIVSSAVATAIESVLGGSAIPEVALTSPFAPGVTHRFTDLGAYTEEVANARIYAGFHYRFSTVVGKEMGRKIGAHAAKTVLTPLKQVAAR